MQTTSTLCTEVYDMQISEAAGGVPAAGAEPCRFPKLEECAHFHYERVQLPQLTVTLQTSMDQSLHSQHTSEDDGTEWHMVQVTSGDECWLLQRNYENFKMLDDQLHQCIYDRKISQLSDLSSQPCNDGEDVEAKLISYLKRFCSIADNSLNCGPILNWLQMDNKGHRLLVPSEESRSINTPAVAAAYSVRRYVSQARDELNLEVGDMISVIDMASPGESMWWRGKRGFQVGFFPQHCVHIIGDKVPRNMPLPPPVVGSLALSPIKPVLRKHGKLIAFFRSFILNRPSRRRLKQSGILKERVFGCDLGEHLLNSGHDIPMVLKCCAEFIETHGIVDGIYRLSGVTSNIQKLRNAFDEDRIPNLYTEDILQDIHSVASLLKMYFRELPNPLCTYQLYQSFVNAVQGCNAALRDSENDHERLLKMREAVQKLPPPHYRTLEYLMRHLARVAKHGTNTGMTTRNVAIVWAPNLLRCAELEIGGVAALQGVGVQAVVTEFLICYTDLIFCDHLPNLDKSLLDKESALSPKKCRPKSLAISTPTKLITLEEARSKHYINKTDECNYIEVGGGPSNLPKKYHTVIELPAGARKRLSKRSPIGWRSFFSKSRNTSQNSLTKNRKASTPGIIIPEKSVTESDLTDMKRKLRSVKSAESLTSGHSEPASNEIDVLGPLHSLIKPTGHNRSVSHDSYFDTIQNSQNNSEGSLLDLSEIQLNFELEESEMRIFSEDESLVSSPRIHKDVTHRRVLTRARPEEFSSAANSGNPSPKKQARVVISPDSLSRKRTRLEDQLSDIQYIDCSTPDNTCIISTTAVVHSLPEPQSVIEPQADLYQPKNKSPRNSDVEIKRQSLNLESTTKPPNIPKSLTELDINGKILVLGKSSNFATPTLQSPIYKQLGDSSSPSTPGVSPDMSPPTEIGYQKLHKREEENSKPSPTYENVLTTISITYKSPSKNSAESRNNVDSIYEDVLNVEKAVVPTSVASLPIQEASQPSISDAEQRPKSLSALEDLNKNSKGKFEKLNSSCNPIYSPNHSEEGNLECYTTPTALQDKSSFQDTPPLSFRENKSPCPFQFVKSSELSPSELSLSEITDNLSTSHTSLSFPVSPSRNSMSPIVSPTHLFETMTASPVETNVCNSSGSSFVEDARLLRSQDDLSPFGAKDVVFDANSKPTYSYGDEDGETVDHQQTETLPRPESFNLIDFSPTESESVPRPNSNDKRKSSETESLDDNAIYQQVKYFRRSVHEINALLDLDKESNQQDNSSMETALAESMKQQEDEMQSEIEYHYDSLEPDNLHIYENVDLNKKEEGSDHPDEEVKKTDVRSLANKFENNNEQVVPESTPVAMKISKFEEIQKNGNATEIKSKLANNSLGKKIYDKDTLPPCLRARNLKHAIKTRSLDEDEFKREFNPKPTQRRKSMDEHIGFKLNTLPKQLNQPKVLQPIDNDKLNSIHMAHSTENVSAMSNSSSEQLRRERIEKYKEERRKFLQDKYRSESFKEDKDILLSRLKVFKCKDEKPETEHACLKTRPDDENKTTARWRCSGSDDVHEASSSDYTADSLEEDVSKVKPTRLSGSSDPKRVVKTEDFKSKTAMFETPAVNQRKLDLQIKHKNELLLNKSSPDNNKMTSSNVYSAKKVDIDSDDNRNSSDGGEDFLRNRRRDDDFVKSERRRYTFELRERETEAERNRRLSLESRSPRKEKTSPSYCIKDMKAIFESKSKQ